MNTIAAKEKILDKIFCEDYLFEIPPYQRPYSWETEHAEDLFNDLHEAFRESR